MQFFVSLPCACMSAFDITLEFAQQYVYPQRAIFDDTFYIDQSRLADRESDALFAAEWKRHADKTFSGQSGVVRPILLLAQDEKLVCTKCIYRIDPEGHKFTSGAVELPKICDLVTAIYIPSSHSRASLRVGWDDIEWTNRLEYVSTEECIRQERSHLVSMKTLCQRDLTFDQFAICTDDELLYQGIEYQRVELLEPFIPMVSFQMYKLALTLERPCSILLECCYLQAEPRRAFLMGDIRHLPGGSTFDAMSPEVRFTDGTGRKLVCNPDGPAILSPEHKIRQDKILTTHNYIDVNKPT